MQVHIGIPAWIYVTVEADDVDSITPEQVFEEVGKYPQVKHGENFDVDDFEVIDWDE